MHYSVSTVQANFDYFSDGEQFFQSFFAFLIYLVTVHKDSTGEATEIQKLQNRRYLGYAGTSFADSADCRCHKGTKTLRFRCILFFTFNFFVPLRLNGYTFHL